ncbi:MAG TPA: hypothetical protein VJ997_10880 [Longimicrobiales bacterium]|nr:hypothetical protein [Longimicrobiales bacterium]
MNPTPVQELTDEELDAYIRTRLRQAGVDIGVLPADDPDAPADQRGILEGARRFLRSTPPAILGFEPDVQLVAPALYPAALGATLGDGGDG